MKVRENDEDWVDASVFKPYGELSDPDEVASKYAEWLWGNNPCDPSYFEKNIEVMDDEGKVHKFSVTAEATVIFDAEELEDVAED